MNLFARCPECNGLAKVLDTDNPPVCGVCNLEMIITEPEETPWSETPNEIMNKWYKPYPGDGTGEDDLADHNTNEADDYRDEQ